MITTDCCGSEMILQDAWIDPSTLQDRVISLFDHYICDNDKCSNYGQECSIQV